MYQHVPRQPTPPGSHLLNARVTIPSMFTADTGRAPWRVIIIQVLLLSGLAVFFKIYLPYRARDAEAEAAAAREQRINALFENAVEKDTTREISVPLGGEIVKRHPQKLRLVLSPREVEDSLGLPAKITMDFRGGQHLMWLGTAHKLEASFNAGRLYCLTLEDLTTGRGVMVYASPTSWHPY